MPTARQWTAEEYARWSAEEVARWSAPPETVGWIKTFFANSRVESAFRSLARSGVHPTWISTMVLSHALEVGAAEEGRPLVRRFIKKRKALAAALRDCLGTLEPLSGRYVASECFTDTLPHIKALAVLLEDDAKWATWQRIFRPDGKYISELTLLPQGRRPKIGRNVCLAKVDAVLMEKSGHHWNTEVSALLDAAFKDNIEPESLERARKRQKKKRA